MRKDFVHHFLKGTFFTLLVVSTAYMLASLIGCRTQRVVSATTETNAVALNDSSKIDSVRLDSVIAAYQSHIELDQVVGVKGGWVSLVEANDDPPDTTVKNGPATLETHTNDKGQRVTKCSCDSVTLLAARLIKDSITTHSELNKQKTSQLVVVDSIEHSTLKQVVTTAHAGRLSSLWEYVKNFFAIVGLLAVVVIIIHFLKPGGIL